MNDINKLLKEINSIQSELRHNGKISKCFHHKQNECNGKIKKAHSIQRNGRLSLIEGNVNGNKKVYSFVEFTVNKNSTLIELKPIGKSDASTFNGFCDYHDNSLFSAIENQDFIDSDEQCFIFSYRAFAHTHHMKTEQVKTFKTPSKFNLILGKDITPLLQGTIVAYNEGVELKKRMSNILDAKSYNDLDYLSIDLGAFYPIACSSAMSPKYSPKTNEKLNYHSDFTIPYEDVFINIIPDVNGTKVILSCFPDHKKSIQYIDEFESLSFYNQKKILSGIMVGLVENTFISPYIYNKLSEIEKNKLVQELSDTNIYSKKHQKKHFKSVINFFENRFIKE